MQGAVNASSDEQHVQPGARGPDDVCPHAVPDGEHELFIWKVGYNAPARMVDVKSDARVRIEAEILPTVNPDSYWQG